MTRPRILRLTLPYLPPAEYGANRARGAAWQRQFRVSHGKGGAVDTIIALVNETGWHGPPMQKAVLRITFYLPDKRRRDGMMLLERCKPWFDGLVYRGGAGVIKDDDLGTIGFPVPAWEYRKGQPGTTIEIQEVEAGCKTGS